MLAKRPPVRVLEPDGVAGVRRVQVRTRLGMTARITGIIGHDGPYLANPLLGRRHRIPAAQSFAPTSSNQPVLTGGPTGLGVIRLLEAIRRFDR